MSLVVAAAPQVQQTGGPRPLRAPVAWLDVLAVAGLLLLWAAVLVWRSDAVPLQLWDESRNANNALEMAVHGHWLTPTYDGAIDHWNTKPPLLIWAMAGLLKLGLPALTALRLTSWLAAAATALTLWGTLRYTLKDAIAGFVAGVLLLSAALYIGPHAARTGDYDALESAFMLGYVLAIWRALEVGRGRWLLLAGTLMALGVLTKGVAALLPLPGLALYALARPRPLGRLLTSGWTWAGAALFIGITCGYYLSREAFDPGYLSAVAANELGGRFLKVTEKHGGGWDYYLRLIILRAEPCAGFGVLGLMTAFGQDTPRRRLVWAAAAAMASLLVVLSISSSKMTWYATPLVALISLIGGLGLSDGLRLARARSPWFYLAACAALATTLAGAAGFAVWWNQSGVSWRAANPDPVHLHYGELLAALRMRDGPAHVTVLDRGFVNDAGFVAYDPMLKFYAELAGARGLRVQVIHAVDGLKAGDRLASCDARAIWAAGRAVRLVEARRIHGCLSARVWWVGWGSNPGPFD